MKKPKTNNSYRILPTTLVGRVLLVLLALTGIVLVAGCGNTLPTQLIIVDVSNSTGKVQEEYKQQLEKEIEDSALKEQTIFVIPAAGDPLTSSNSLSCTFTTQEQNEYYAKIDLLKQAKDCENQVEEAMKNQEVDRNHTALIRTLLVAGRIAGNTKGPVEVEVISDGIENSQDFTMYSDQLDDTTITATLDRLQADGLIPTTLKDTASVHFILPSYDPGNSASDPDPLKVESFWKGWAQRAGVSLIWG